MFFERETVGKAATFATPSNFNRQYLALASNTLGVIQAYK
jgi:hypothetical protein